VDGYGMQFPNCDIYYSAATGAHEVHGDIRAKYNSLGGDDSRLKLGLPVTDEQSTTDKKGRYNQFSGNVSIYWTRNTGPMMVRGAIKDYWVAHAAQDGFLGYPTSDEIALGGGAAYSDFQNGVLYWDGKGILAPATAGLTKDEMASIVSRYVNRIIQSIPQNMGQSILIKDVSFLGTSDTSYDFFHSNNRDVAFRIEGEVVLTPFTMDLHFHAGTTGSTRVSVFYDDGSFLMVDDSPDPNEAQPLKLLLYYMGLQRDLIDTTVPANVKMLSFKVLADGGIQLYLQPVGGAQQVAQQVRSQWNALLK
jgi:hypothetical protein